MACLPIGHPALHDMPTLSVLHTIKVGLMLNSHSLDYSYSVSSYINKNVTIAKLYKLIQIDKGNVKERTEF